MKHNGINATREALKDQLVLAADWKIRRESRPLARLARWVRRGWQ